MHTVQNNMPSFMVACLSQILRLSVQFLRGLLERVLTFHLLFLHVLLHVRGSKVQKELLVDFNLEELWKPADFYILAYTIHIAFNGTVNEANVRY